MWAGGISLAAPGVALSDGSAGGRWVVAFFDEFCENPGPLAQYVRHLQPTQDSKLDGYPDQ
ncbi:protein of unknown function [Pararobbsia alpina]